MLKQMVESHECDEIGTFYDCVRDHTMSGLVGIVVGDDGRVGVVEESDLLDDGILRVWGMAILPYDWRGFCRSKQ